MQHSQSYNVPSDGRSRVVVIQHLVDRELLVVSVGWRDVKQLLIFRVVVKENTQLLGVGVLFRHYRLEWCLNLYQCVRAIGDKLQVVHGVMGIVLAAQA